MNKLHLIIAGVATAFILLESVNYVLSADLRAVQSGEVTLLCVMKDGERVIDGSKVTGLIGSKWTFEDGGYAGNCRIIEGGE